MRQYFWMPLRVGLLFVLLNNFFSVDQKIATLIFQAEGFKWSLKKYWLTQGIIHDDGRFLIEFLFISLILLFFTSLKYFKHYTKGLGYLIVSIGSCYMLISLLKTWLNLPCPWDFHYFGGVWSLPALHSITGCAPAGHAGSGYALMALFFFCKRYFPNYRYYGLGLGISLGIIFGIGQQLRGAHFLSHDVASALLCWSIAVLFFRLFFPESIQNTVIPNESFSGTEEFNPTST